MPQTREELRDHLTDLPHADVAARAAAKARNDQLTKPQGALGRLEDSIQWLAAWQAREIPRLDKVQVLVFAGNHGVVAQGVSAFPAEVTAQMVANFQTGGAAINQLCAAARAELTVLALDLDYPTADFTEAPALGWDEFLDALRQGMARVDPDADLVCIGEMGIGNTTVAAALAHALYHGVPEDWTGRGTGVDEAGLARKALAVANGRKRHAAALDDPLDIARRLGGRELAAMAGAALRDVRRVTRNRKMIHVFSDLWRIHIFSTRHPPSLIPQLL